MALSLISKWIDVDAFVAMLLTLDETTLFYHYRRTPAANKKLSGIIKNWEKAIEPGPVQACTNSSKTRTSASSVRSTSTSQQKSTTARSTAAVPAITDKVAATSVNDEAEELEQHDNDDGGGLADEFELDGPEGEFAKLSPIKGKKRVTNDVSSLL